MCVNTSNISAKLQQIFETNNNVLVIFTPINKMCKTVNIDYYTLR